MSKIDKLLAQEKNRYMDPDWTLPESDYPNMAEKVNTVWEEIKKEQPELDLTKLESNLDRIFAVSFGDSGIRQALFYRMCEFYNVDYDVIYEKWLEDGRKSIDYEASLKGV